MMSICYFHKKNLLKTLAHSHILRTFDPYDDTKSSYYPCFINEGHKFKFIATT